MKQVFFCVVIFVLSMLFTQCAPSRMVKPLEEKQHAITANVGGPLIGFAGTVIPVPFTALGYGYGLRANTTIFANLHTTSLLYGVIQTDLGVCRNFKTWDNGLAISSNLVANLSVDKWQGNFRFWPQLDVNVYKPFHEKKSFWYAGFDSWYELARYRAHDYRQPVHVFLNPHAGLQWGKKTHWSYQFETKWLIPYIKNTPNQIKYKAPGGNGAIGIYFGVTYRFAPKSQEVHSTTQAY